MVFGNTSAKKIARTSQLKTAVIAMKKEPSEHLYKMQRGNEILGYAYGEDWVAQALYMDDMRYSTPEEAKAAWEEYKAQQKEKSELIQHVGYSPEQMGYDK